MSVLKRNKEVIKAHDAGRTFVDLGKEYGIAPTALSQIYYGFENLIDRPYYDRVTEMDFSAQVGTKLVNALHKYERLHSIDLTLDEIRDMEREEFIIMRGVGVSVARAFDRFREALNDES